MQSNSKWKPAKRKGPQILKINWNDFYDLSRILKKICDDYSYNFYVRTLAERLTQGTGSNYRQKVYKAFAELYKRFTHNKDPKGREFLQTPEFLAKKILTEGSFSGDCDDATVFFISLFRSIGFDGYMVYTSPIGDPPYTHTFAVIETPEGEFIKADFLKPGGPPSYEPIKVIAI